MTELNRASMNSCFLILKAAKYWFFSCTCRAYSKVMQRSLRSPLGGTLGQPGEYVGDPVPI